MSIDPTAMRHASIDVMMFSLGGVPIARHISVLVEGEAAARREHDNELFENLAVKVGTSIHHHPASVIKQDDENRVECSVRTFLI